MHDQFWGSGIALDLFLGGMGVGTFLYAILVSAAYQDRFQQVSRIAAILTPLCVAFGFVFLIGHLGHPERFYVVYTKLRLTSPLWWGAWFQAIFFLVSMAYAWMWLRNSDAARRRLVGYIGVPFALSVGVYHGFVLMVFKSRPLWNTGPVAVTAICGFVLTGVALVVLVLSFLPREKVLVRELKVSRNILGGAILVQLFTIFLWISSLYFGSGESQDAMRRLLTDHAFLLWGIAIVLGLVIPLLVGGVALIRERQSGRFSYAVPMLTSLLVLIGGLALRYVVIVAA